MKEKLLYPLATLPILLLVLALHHYKLQPFETFSLRFNDINFDLQHKEPSKSVVFVAVDEPSVNRYGRWPWNREIIAQGIEEMREADVLLMDMIFSEPTLEEQDARLAESLSNVKNSVCGFFLRHKATQDISDDEMHILQDSSLDLLQSQVGEFGNPSFVSAPYAEMNIAQILEGCTLSGSFTTLQDESDHLFRSYPIAVYFKDILYPSLGIQGLRLKFNEDIQRISQNELSINGHTIGVDERGFVRLNFYRPQQYNIVSFLDVATQKVEPSYFKDKIVILGITEVGAGDVATTPMGALYGPLLHYTFISNLLEGHIIKEPKTVVPILIALLVLIPLVFVFVFKKVFYRVLSYLLIYALLYAYIRYLFIDQMIYIDLFYPLLSIVLSAIAVESIAFYLQEKGGRFLRNAFSSYLSADLLDKLIKHPEALSLGGEKKELTILFSDIRGFTTISESMDPVSLIKLLNRYFTPMTDAVLKHGGYLDKYIGDAVMAFFNAPVDVPEHAKAACRTALEMIDQLNKLNKILEQEGIKPIHIGIGINSDEVVVGNMGSNTRFNYTVIGDGVNLASRVEGLTKNYGVEILITEFMIQKLDDEFIYRKIEPVKVKGKDEAVVLYQLLATNEANRSLVKRYNEALGAYIDGDVQKAKEIFASLVQEVDDHPSKYFLDQINEGHSWGVHKMTTK